MYYRNYKNDDCLHNPCIPKSTATPPKNNHMWRASV